MELVVYLDPAAPTSARVYFEVRRLVAERPEELRVVLRWTPPTGMAEPGDERVRVWAAAVAPIAGAGPVLRAIAREGKDRLRVRLSSRDERAHLAHELGIDPRQHEAAWNDPCVQRRLTATRRQADALSTRRSNTTLFAIGDTTFEDNLDLEFVRVALGKFNHQMRRSALATPPLSPDVGASRPRLRRPTFGGLILGGLGLPHRLLTIADDEEDLFFVLAPALQFRRDHPGILAIQIVAHGPALTAQRLRRRLCAAEGLGLAAPYVASLAIEPSVRRSDPTTLSLLEELDAVPEETCGGEPKGSEPAMQDGVWLDGSPGHRAELEEIEAALRILEAAQRPLSVWLTRSTESL